RPDHPSSSLLDLHRDAARRLPQYRVGGPCGQPFRDRVGPAIAAGKRTAVSMGDRGSPRRAVPGLSSRRRSRGRRVAAWHCQTRRRARTHAADSPTRLSAIRVRAAPRAGGTLVNIGPFLGRNGLSRVHGNRSWTPLTFFRKTIVQSSNSLRGSKRPTTEQRITESRSFKICVKNSNFTLKSKRRFF